MELLVRSLEAQEVAIRARAAQPFVQRSIEDSGAQGYGSVGTIPFQELYGSGQGGGSVLGILAALKHEAPQARAIALARNGRYLLGREAVALDAPV